MMVFVIGDKIVKAGGIKAGHLKKIINHHWGNSRNDLPSGYAGAL